MPIRRDGARARIELQRSSARAPDEAAHTMLPGGAGGVSQIWSVLSSGALDGMMLSIIVAVHNQLGHNRLFLEGIRRYSTGPYEVIVVDNHSTDGSAEFFEANGCQVIRKRWLLVSPSRIVE